MEEVKSKFTKLQWFGYLFILLLIILSFSGLADKIAISLMTETQQSTAAYALILKTVAGALTFIPDNDSLAPFIDTFDRAGTLLFFASITITLQKVTLILLQTPIFSVIMLAMLIATIVNKLSNALNDSFTILVRKYLIILLLIRFFLTASAMIVYGGIGALLDSNDENNAKRTELLNFKIQELTNSEQARITQNAILQSQIDKLESKIETNQVTMKDIGTKWIGTEDERVVKLREENNQLEQQIDALKNQQKSSFNFFTGKIDILTTNMINWFKKISDGIFTTVSIILLKIVIFPLIIFLMAYKLGRSILGNDAFNLIKNSFEKRNRTIQTDE